MESEGAGASHASMTPRRAFEVAGEFVWRFANRAEGNDLIRLISDTLLGEGSGPHDPAAWWDWVSSADWVEVGNEPQTGADPADSRMSDDRVFVMPEPREVEYEEQGSTELSLAEAFVVMTEFVGRFLSRYEQNSIGDLLEVLKVGADDEVDAVAWRNWVSSVGWVLHGNTLRKCTWSDVLSFSLYVFMPPELAVPKSFYEVDPESNEGGYRDVRAQWVHLPQKRGVSDLGLALAPLLPDLHALSAVDGVIIDLVVWLDSVGDPVGITADAEALAELVPLIRDIWIESEPRNERDKSLVDEIVVRSSIRGLASFSSNDAGERQDMLIASVREVAVESTGGVIEIELIPRSGKAGLVVYRSILEDVVAAGHGVRMVSRG